MTEDSVVPAKPSSVTLGKLSITTLAAGALNILGGATLGRAWITDLGAKYYDALMDQFDVPVGLVTIDNTHLLTQGYEIARGSLLIYATFFLLFAPFLLMIVFATLGGWVSWRRLNGLPDPKWLRQDEGPLLRFFSLMLPALGIFTVCWILWSMIYALPEYAQKSGTGAASKIRQEMMGDCHLCRSFGPKRVIGRPIVADARGLYIATPGGGIAVVPIAGQIFNNAVVKPELMQRSAKR